MKSLISILVLVAASSGQIRVLIAMGTKSFRIRMLLIQKLVLKSAISSSHLMGLL